MSFDQLNLDSRISKAVQHCGYSKPTPIQARCIPEIIAGKDLVACAQTGTGKTAAFVLPSLHRLSLNKAGKKPRILILTPTRELASQITKAASSYGKFLQFNIVSLVGGMSYHQQIRSLSKPVDMIVATPGRLLDHMRSHRVDLSSIETLIFDEADRMLDMGFIDDVTTIAKNIPNNRQTLLFSATVDNKLDNIIKQLLKNPLRIDLSEKITPSKITQELYLTDNEQHKDRLLQHFLSDVNVYKAIIFTATKINADKLARALRGKNFSAAAIHGDLKQNVRNRTLDELRRGKVQFLVATDVAARGIDVSDITHVFNYDLPKFSEDYVHRIGRTGRAGKTGIAISFALPLDIRHVKRIERYTGQPLPLLTIDGLEPTKRFAKTPGEQPKRPSSRKSGGFGEKKKFWFKDKPASRFAEKRAEKPSGSFARKPARKFDDQPTGGFSEKPARKFSNRPAGKFGDKPAGRFADRPTGKFAGKTEGKFAGRPAGKFSGKSEGKFAGKPAGKFADKPAGKFGGKPAGKFAGKPSGKFGDKPAGKFAGRPAGKFAGKPKARAD